MHKAGFILSFLFLGFAFSSVAGELSCNVTVNTVSIQTTNKTVYESMRKNITEFLNNTKWTDDEFQSNEKIECNFYITINDNPTVNKYSATIQVQTARPVFNSSYNSSLFTHIDKEFGFEYIEFQSIEYNEGAVSSNLASVLAFYAYLAIGMDYDSYSKFGGTKYYQKAQEIVNQAQGKEYNGWEAMKTEKNNRYWLVNQLLDKQFQPLREAIYKYHRLGLDIMYEKQEAGRNEISDALKMLLKVNKNEPSSFLMQVFFNSKRDEISKIFSAATPTEIDEIKDIVKELDAANSSRYFEKK